MGAAPIGRAQPTVRHARQPEPAPVRREADRVEVSREAREARTEPVRRDLVDRVRRELAEGTYENDEKLNLAIDNFIIKSLDVQA
jgi:hypothetical protein